MPPADSYDLLREWALGRLPPDEALRFQREMAANPELRAAADEFAAVAKWTEVAAHDAPESRLRIEDVFAADAATESAATDPATAGPAAATRPMRLLSGRRVAAVAAALVLAAVGAWAFFGSRATPPAPPAPLRLEAVPLSRPAGAPPPAILASYAPVKDGAINWLRSREDARAVAKATQRDVLVYGFFPGCPMCREMDRTTFKDAKVVEAVPALVPVRVDLSPLLKGDPKKIDEIMEHGWPYFAIERPDGTTIKEFGGMQKAPAMRSQLEQAAGAPPPAWDAAKDSAIRAGQVLEAHDALESARARAGTDPTTARADLEAAAKRLAGTPAGADLERVLARWTKDGAFPPLAEAGK